MLATEHQNEAHTLLQHRPPYQSPEEARFEEASLDNPNEWFIVPRCSSNYFTGRNRYGAILQEKFKYSIHDSDRQESEIFVVYGLEGSGKTQFCLRYVEDNRERYGFP